MRRFDFTEHALGCRVWHEMEAAEDGEWVRYEDARKRIAELEAALRDAKDDIRAAATWQRWADQAEANNEPYGTY